MTTPEREYLSGRVRVVVGDITKQDVVAVVNAANSTLLGGGGVDGAIHRVGGPSILKECEQIRATRFPKGLPTGLAVITSGGDLPARFVIHTVGPIYDRSQNNAALLTACYQNSLLLAREHSISSVAFPSISTGAYGYPPDEAATVSSLAIKEFCESNTQPVEVRLVFFNQNAARVFSRYQKFE